MKLRVKNLPLAVDRSLYQEATDAYLDLSHKHIEALYVFGTVSYPGLSDLDFLVVPKDTYLAPLRVHLMDRLPSRFDRIIEHEVFVVPEPQLRVCAYRRPERFKLVYGRDVLADIAAEDSVGARVCDVLELVHNKMVFLTNLQRTGVLNAQSCIRVFNGQQYNVRRLAELGLLEENGYGATIDALRAQCMADPTEACVLQMYDAFEQCVTACARALHARLGPDLRSVAQIAAVSRGNATVPFEGFQVEDARQRADIITEYLQELVKRNFWYGFMFLARLFPTPPTNSVVDRAVSRGLRSGLRRWRRLRSLPSMTRISRDPLPNEGPALV